MVDSEGRRVGSVVGVEYLNPIVAFNVGGLVLTLKLVDDRLYGYAYPYFQSGNCTGPAYVQRVASTFPATAVDHSYRVYVDTGQAPVLVQVSSYDSLDACTSVSFWLWVVPASVVLDLGQQFTPPFGLQ